MASGVIKQSRIVVEYRSLTTDASGIAWVGTKQGYKLISAQIFSGEWLDCNVATLYDNNVAQYGVHVKISETGNPVANSTDTWHLVWIKL